MPHLALEIADIFGVYGPAWRSTNVDLADSYILAIQQTTQRPAVTLPTSNPHRPNRPHC